MIAYLRGKLLAVMADNVIVDVGGVGYQVYISRVTMGTLPATGGEVALHIHTHVREDAILLYGFATQAEKDVFLLLVDVSGVGPRLALAILSEYSPGELAAVIGSQDAKMLTRVPGVGRKTAERLLLELRDKMAAPATAPVAATSAAIPAAGVVDDAIAALTALGYSAALAEESVRAAAADVDLSTTDAGELLRAALRRMSA